MTEDHDDGDDRRSWRDEGVYRLNLDLPMSVWNQIVAEANRLKIKPTQVVRMELSKRFSGEAG